MSNEQGRLKDFVAWVRRRRVIKIDAPVDVETIEYVTQGIERFIAGEKNPWPKPQGNKPKPNLTWEIYWMVNFDPAFVSLHKKIHAEPDGMYEAVGKVKSLTAKAVESQVRSAKAKLETEEGRIEFCEWVAKKQNATIVSYILAPKK